MVRFYYTVFNFHASSVLLDDDYSTSVDLSGYWVLSKTEHFDDCLKSLGVPWIVRKAALKFAQNGMEIIRHAGSAVHVTSLNPKGSWHRVYDTSKTVVGEDVAGNECQVKTFWDGDVLCSRLEGSPFGTCETWRYVRGSTMVVKTSFTMKPKTGVPQTPPREEDGQVKEAVCYWWYERMEVLEQQLGVTKKALHKHLAADQKRVEHATRKDTKFMRSILLDWSRWESPADEFIVVPGGSKSRIKGGLRSRQRSPATSSSCTPLTMSASPSATGLNKMQYVDDSKAASSVSTSTKYHDEVTAILSNPKHNLPIHPVKRATSPGMMSEHQAANPGMTRRFGSSDNLQESALQRPPHYRSTSSESFSSMTKRTKGHHDRPPTAAEMLMQSKLHEFVETYGITSVIPVGNPHDTSEPQLLGMSPEQAEETTAKLRELETDMLLRRQEESSSWTFCGLVISLERNSIPDHLRVWEMTLF